MTMYVPFVDLTPKGKLAADLYAAYERVMASGTYIKGREVARFERNWAEYVGTEHCKAVGSGTEALGLLLRPYRCGIRIPGNSKPTLDAARKFGYTVIIEDVGRDRLITSARGEVVVPVHLYGNPVDMDRIKGRMVFEDACQAHGSTWNGKKCGTLADAAAWSFYPTKNLGAYGDAGAVTTDDGAIVGKIRGRMDPLQAAFLNVKLPYLDKWNGIRREIALRYMDGLEGVGLPVAKEGTNWHLFVVTHEKRDRLQAEIYEKGVETMVHYEGDGEVLSLPCNPWMTEDQVEHVIGSVNECAR